MNNLLIAQSGGPTTAINATLVGVLKAASLNDRINKVYGSQNGIEGVLKENLIDLEDVVKDTKLQEELSYTPSSALGTCRYKMKSYLEDDEQYEEIVRIFSKYNIKYFIYIGGNDSMDTVDKLSKYCKMKKLDIVIVGAPKTIDNDLSMIDHCPGFGSAAKYIATTVGELACDIGAYDIPAVTIVEVMGRNAGWLTASAALAKLNGDPGADMIYLCEREFDSQRFLGDLRAKLKEKPDMLVVVSEGIRNREGKYLSEGITDSLTDCFGHKQIAGAAKALVEMVRREIGCKVRSIELNLMQRAAAHVASDTDIKESLMLGQKALICAIEEKTGMMSSIKRVSDYPYQVEYITVPVSEVANKEKKVPLDWITESGYDITDEFITYLKPLIQGEVNINYKNGIPVRRTLY